MTPSDPIERYLARLRAGLHVPRRKPSSSWPRRRITCARLAFTWDRALFSGAIFFAVAFLAVAAGYDARMVQALLRRG